MMYGEFEQFFVHMVVITSIQILWKLYFILTIHGAMQITAG